MAFCMNKVSIYHIEATLDITDSDKLSNHSSCFTKKDIYSPKVVVTLLQVFPNLFPCVYIQVRRAAISSACFITPRYQEASLLSLQTARPDITFAVDGEQKKQ